MKKAFQSTFLLLMLINLMFLTSCFEGENQQSKGRYSATLAEGPKENSDGEYVVLFLVSGMGCHMCEGRIERNLADQEGILEVLASKINGSVSVTYNNSLTNTTKIKRHIESIK